jgi:NAD(P)-dependent dehydrogenase (short-subunit alcohol dehydrogenase family)
MTDIRGKVCVVTGANSGIGKATAQGLAAAGASVLMVCRDGARGAAAQQEIRTATGNAAVELWQADLASLADVRRLAAELLVAHPVIHVLINNAGVMVEKRQMSADGFELQLAVNHLAPFLLTRLLEPALAAGAPSRVVNVSSRVHSMGHIDFDDLQSTRKYRMFAAYGRSKLACVMATYDLAERWQALGITVNCLHPGVIDTNLGGMPGFVKKLLPKADKGARTSLYLAMSPEVADVTGRYFSNCKVAKSSAESHDRAVRARLWQETERLVGLA